MPLANHLETTQPKSEEELNHLTGLLTMWFKEPM